MKVYVTFLKHLITTVWWMPKTFLKYTKSLFVSLSENFRLSHFFPSLNKCLSANGTVFLRKSFDLSPADFTSLYIFAKWTHKYSHDASIIFLLPPLYLLIETIFLYYFLRAKNDCLNWHFFSLREWRGKTSWNERKILLKSHMRWNRYFSYAIGVK